MVAAVVEAVGDLAPVEGDQEMIAVVTAATRADIIRIDVLGIVVRLLALSSCNFVAGAGKLKLYVHLDLLQNGVVLIIAASGRGFRIP
jgi:hypothetical protein